ncbi:hypothetical protein D9611_006152 [Ephemerocybe angulata]|uniref:Uncharacterized protein n=1 Tax=Ephemerocybe angulata TaxID=980116 RepID=A0A8H5FLI9_9AGAR|nr:hypothetical protein D9611_006152 [Tulosesus angulatus]
MTAFGDFAPLCTNTPSYPWCNLFYRQLQRNASDILTGPSATPASAPVGINPKCGIPRLNHDGSISNVANIAACGAEGGCGCVLVSLSIRPWPSFVFLRRSSVHHPSSSPIVLRPSSFVLPLVLPPLIPFIPRYTYPQEIVILTPLLLPGRIELRSFLTLYLLTLPLQLLSTGALLAQGSTALVVLTAVHAGMVAALFWTLLANAIVATQVVEDGTLSSLIVFANEADLAVRNPGWTRWSWSPRRYTDGGSSTSGKETPTSPTSLTSSPSLPSVSTLRPTLYRARPPVLVPSILHPLGRQVDRTARPPRPHSIHRAFLTLPSLLAPPPSTVLCPFIHVFVRFASVRWFEGWFVRSACAGSLARRTGTRLTHPNLTRSDRSLRPRPSILTPCIAPLTCTDRITDPPTQKPLPSPSLHPTFPRFTIFSTISLSLLRSLRTPRLFLDSPFGIFTILFLGVTTYVSLDIGLGVTELIGGVSSPPEDLKNIPLFVLTSVWPAA